MTVDCSTNEKRPYARPEFRELGDVEELTRGSGASTDAAPLVGSAV
ncbi:MAG: lasso RiPP family leader peptide-containing protein [Acidobacteria bacterium]|nr:lasso RiPP family leader peptide-containing protein [Acidobacteriota bacterium]